jgi:hypothetical protein
MGRHVVWRVRGEDGSECEEGTSLLSLRAARSARVLVHDAIYRRDRDRSPHRCPSRALSALNAMPFNHSRMLMASQRYWAARVSNEKESLWLS